MEGKCVREWVRNYLVYHHPSGVIICTRCDTPDCFRSLAGLRSHLREKHGYTGTVGATIANEILLKSDIVKEVSRGCSGLSTSFVLPPCKLPKCFEGFLTTDSQKLYWNAPEYLNEKNQSLPAVPHLPIVTGFQCAIDGCFQSFQSKDSLRAHHHKQHKSSSSAFLRLSSPNNVKLQSLGNHGNKRKYFPVHEINSTGANNAITTTTAAIPSSPLRKLSSVALDNTLDDQFAPESRSLRLKGKNAVSLDDTLENADSNLHQVSNARESPNDERTKSFCHSANRICESRNLPSLEEHDRPHGALINNRVKADSLTTEKRSAPSDKLAPSAPKKKKQVTFYFSKNCLAGEEATKTCSMIAGKIVDREKSLNAATAKKEDAKDDRMKHAGTQVWDMIKNLNPAFKGHCARMLSARRKPFRCDIRFCNRW